MELQTDELLRERTLDAFKRRVTNAPKKIIKDLTGVDYVKPDLLIRSEYAILSGVSLSQAVQLDRLKSKTGEQYPFLLSTTEEPMVAFPDGASNVMVSGLVFKAHGCICRYSPNFSVIFNKAGAEIRKGQKLYKYHLDLVMIISYGSDHPKYLLPDMFEGLMVRALEKTAEVVAHE